jgi:hypothetical protein
MSESYLVEAVIAHLPLEVWLIFGLEWLTDTNERASTRHNVPAPCIQQG